MRPEHFLLELERHSNRGKISNTKTTSVPISEARTDLFKLVEQVQSQQMQVILTSDGREKARIVPVVEKTVPWRTEKADDPKIYGDLQSPVLDEWE